MKTTRFTDEQIIGFLKQAEAGMLSKVAKFILICDGDFEVETFPLDPKKRAYWQRCHWT
jgi:hypothetical protein